VEIKVHKNPKHRIIIGVVMESFNNRRKVVKEIIK
jgi:hypothetical protein